MLHLATTLAVAVLDDDVNLMQTAVRHRVSRDFTETNISLNVPDTSDIVAALGAGASPEVASLMVEKLARSSVATNSTIDDDTKTALESLREMLVGTEQANIQVSHDADQNFLDGQFSTIQVCGSSMSTSQGEDAAAQSEIDTKRTTHADCRGVLGTLEDERDTACNALASFEAGVSAPSCAKPGHDLMASWFAEHRTWVIAAEATWTTLNDACELAMTAYNTKDTTCDLNQGQFETNFCVWREQVHGTCVTYENCFATALDNYANGQIAVQDREKGRKVDFTATEKIKCYIDVLLDDSANDDRATKLQECQQLCAAADGEVNTCTDHLHINYHDMPNVQTCSRSAVASYPCLDDFVSQYVGFVDLRDCVACPDLPIHLSQPGVLAHSPWDWETNAVTTSCDSNPYNPGSELDGNDGTRNGCNHGYTLDLGEVRTIQETYIDWEACQCEAIGAAQLLSSVDGTNWSPYYFPMFYQWGGHKAKWYRAPVTARYFRVWTTASAGSEWFSMWEYRLIPMPADAPVWPELQVVLVSGETLNIQQMQAKCPDGFGLVKVKSADHVRHLAVKFTEAGGDWNQACGAAIASKTSHNPNRYATLGTQETDVTPFLQEVYDNQEFGGDLWTHQSSQDVTGFGWSTYSSLMNGADNRQMHDFGGHCSQAVFCEKQ